MLFKNVFPILLFKGISLYFPVFLLLILYLCAFRPIYREINRNMYYEADDHKMNGYYPLTAQELYRRRRQSLQFLSAILDLKPS